MSLDFTNVPKLFFIHTPKSAGTSLFENLQEILGPDQICPARFDDLHLIPQFIINKWRYFIVHGGYIHSKLVKGEVITATFVRDPIERFISNIRHIRRHSAMRSSGIGVIMSLIDDESFIMSSKTENLATYIANDATIRFSQIGFAADSFDPNIDYSIILNSKVNIALDNLSTIKFVGISEAFDDSFLKLCEILRLPITNKIIKSNFALEERPEIYNRDDIIGRIRYLCRFDNIVYKSALDLFNTTYGGMKFTLNISNGTKQIIENNNYIVSESNGHVLTGPYVDLPSGDYTVKFHILQAEKKSELAKISCDVVSGYGSHEISKVNEIYIDSNNFSGNISIDFELKNFTQNIEFRVATYDILAAISCDVILIRNMQ